MIATTSTTSSHKLLSSFKTSSSPVNKQSTAVQNFHPHIKLSYEELVCALKKACPSYLFGENTVLSMDLYRSIFQRTGSLKEVGIFFNEHKEQLFSDAIINDIASLVMLASDLINLPQPIFVNNKELQIFVTEFYTQKFFEWEVPDNLISFPEGFSQYSATYSVLQNLQRTQTLSIEQQKDYIAYVNTVNVFDLITIFCCKIKGHAYVQEHYPQAINTLRIRLQKGLISIFHIKKIGLELYYKITNDFSFFNNPEYLNEIIQASNHDDEILKLVCSHFNNVSKIETPSNFRSIYKEEAIHQLVEILKQLNPSVSKETISGFIRSIFAQFENNKMKNKIEKQYCQKIKKIFTSCGINEIGQNKLNEIANCLIKKNNSSFNPNYFNTLPALLKKDYPLQAEQLLEKLNLINEDLVNDLIIVPMENLQEFKSNSQFVKEIWKLINWRDALINYIKNKHYKIREERNQILTLLKNANAKPEIILRYFLSSLPIFSYTDLFEFYPYIKEYSSKCTGTSMRSLSATSKMLRQLKSVYQYALHYKESIGVDLELNLTFLCLFVLEFKDGSSAILNSNDADLKYFDTSLNQEQGVNSFKIIEIAKNESDNEKTYGVTKRLISFEKYNQIDTISNPEWIRKVLSQAIIAANLFAQDFKLLMQKLNRVYKLTQQEMTELVDIYFELIINPNDIVVTKNDTLLKRQLKTALHSKLTNIEIYESIQKDGGADLDIVADFTQVISNIEGQTSSWWLIHGITLLAISGACGVGMETGFQGDKKNGSVPIFNVLAQHCLNQFVKIKEIEIAGKEKFENNITDELETLKSVVKNFSFKMDECRQIMVYFLTSGKPPGQNLQASHDILNHNFKTHGIPQLYAEANQWCMLRLPNAEDLNGISLPKSSPRKTQPSTDSSTASGNFTSLSLPGGKKKQITLVNFNTDRSFSGYVHLE